MKTVLQVSLNSLNLQEALSIAEKASNEGITWIEAASTLIKAAGLASVTEIRKRYPNATITADMKMIRSPEEVAAAADAGANIVMFYSESDDDLIRRYVEKAKEKNIELMADIYASVFPARDAKRFQDLGVNYLFVRSRDLKAVASAVQIPVAVPIGRDAEAAKRACRKRGKDTKHKRFPRHGKNKRHIRKNTGTAGKPKTTNRGQAGNHSCYIQ